jgi:hypothetical protein
MLCHHIPAAAAPLHLGLLQLWLSLIANLSSINLLQLCVFKSVGFSSAADYFPSLWGF